MYQSRKIILPVVATLMTGLIFSVCILPLIVKSQLEKQVTRATDRTCTVDSVAINPLTLSMEVRGAKLLEKGGDAVFVSFSSLKLRASPASVWRMAPVLSTISLRSPRVHLIRNSANRYNFTDILEKKTEKKSGGQTLFSLNNIAVDNGSLLFDDRAIASPQQHRIEQLTMKIPFISNITYFAKQYTDPDISAVVNGAPFRLRGKLKPFDRGVESIINLELKNIDIPYYSPYFPVGLPVKIHKGELSTTLRITHRLIKGETPDINVSGSLQVNDLMLADRSGRHLVSWKSLDAELSRLALLSASYDIRSIAISRPEVTAARGTDGVWNLGRLAGEKPAGGEQKSGAKPESRKPEFTLGSFRLSDGSLHLADALPKKGYGTDLGRIMLSMDNFSTGGELPASYQLSLVTGRGESAEVSGTIVPASLALSARIKLADLQLEAAYPYLDQLLRGPVMGRADVSCDLAYSQEAGLKIDESLLRIRKLQVPFGPEGGVKLPLVIAEGGSLQLKERRVYLKSIRVDGGRVEFSRDLSGRFSTEFLLQPKVPSLQVTSAAGTRVAPFSWKIGAVDIKGVDTFFTDNLKEGRPLFSLQKINLAASSVAGPKMTEIPFSFTAGYARGTLSARGRLLPAPFRFRGDMGVKQFPLVDLEPYLPEGVNVLLLDGKLDAGLALDLRLEDGRLAGSFQGDGGIHEFYSVDSEEEEDLLKWDSLLFDRFSGTIAPFSLNMSGVTLNNYYARLIVDKSGRINLQDLYTPPEKVAVSVAPVTTGPGKIKIESITLQEGELSFSDYHLNREFSTTMLHLGGRVSGLTSEAAQAADVDLRGNLENHSPLTIVGRINPLRGDLFLDMSINFSEIELSPMTPYSGTYLGYAIDKGKLSLSLKYKVDQKKLTAENSVFLDQFTFGDQVESPKATALPVRLAVALLKDKKGEIHLDLPLTGETSDPKFSIWNLVGQMLKNLLVKAATSPFALLQSAFGTSDDFSLIGFASGSSRLSAPEEEKLKSLVKVLSERPGIKLEVAGFADRERDPEGYRRELLMKKMKNEKFMASVREQRESAGLSPEVVTISPEEESKWLKTVYGKEKFPRPRTPIGTLKSLPDSEMKKLILANTSVSEQQLRTLARERAVVVVNYLVKGGNLPQERIFEKSGDPFAAPVKESSAIGRVEFGVVAK